METLPTSLEQQKTHAQKTHAGLLLKRWLSDEINVRPQYSLRKMARGLGISPSFLSQVMNGRKRMTVDRAVQFSQVLGFSDEATQNLINSVNSEIAQPRFDFRNIDYSKFRALTRWFYIAILELSETRGFTTESSWIARRLRISPLQAAEATAEMKEIGLLTQTSTGLRKELNRIRFATEKSNADIREYHRQMIGKALENLEDASPEAFERRSITGSTLSINPDHLEEAFAMIDELRKKLERKLSQGPCKEVYQLNIQLFNLSHAVDAEADATSTSSNN